MTAATRAAELARTLSGTIRDKTRGLLDETPVDAYLRQIEAIPPHHGYAFVAKAMSATALELKREFGNDGLYRYHQLVLLTMVEQSGARLRAARVPNTVSELYERHFERIVTEVGGNPLSFYDYGNDDFVKDLGICLNRLHPCGAELAEVCFRVPKRIVITGGFLQFLSATHFFVWKLGGFSPYYSLHMDRRFLDDFTPEGWDRTYHRLAELLELHPEVRGVLGTAWFYDPVLEDISPHLTYLRRRREENGAKGFYFTTGDEVVRSALKRSRTRRQLYEQGSYEPRPYYLVWPRNDLIAWSRRNSE